MNMGEGKIVSNQRRNVLFFLCVLLLALWMEGSLSAAQAAPKADDLIDVAFQMLEEGNPFVARFEERSGRKINIQFAQGMPYYFGGKHSSMMYNRIPDYTLRTCEHASGYFEVGKLYFCGMDCSGYINYINKFAHRSLIPTLEVMMTDWSHRQKNHLYDQQEGREAPPWPELKNVLHVGDYLLTLHQGGRYRHIMMYIGTMRDFGYTEGEEPELDSWLDYPLVIHCGLSPVYGERFQKLIEEKPEIYSRATTTDGGVQISIVGVPGEQAPNHQHVQQTDYDYFIMKDHAYWLTVVNMDNLTSWCWYR